MTTLAGDDPEDNNGEINYAVTYSSLLIRSLTLEY